MLITKFKQNERDVGSEIQQTERDATSEMQIK